MGSTERQKYENIARQKMFAIKSLHFILCVGLFYGTWLLFRYNEFPTIAETGYRYNYYVGIAFAILVTFFMGTYNANLFGYTRIRSLALAHIMSQLFSMIIIYMGVSIGWRRFRSPLLFVILLAVYIAIDILYVYEGNKYYFKLNPPKKTLLIYRNTRDRRRFGTISGKPMERLYHIEKEIQFDGTFEELKDELEGFDAVFVAGLNSRCRNGLLKYCEENNIRGLFLPHVGDVIMQGTQHIQTFDSPVLMARRKVLHPNYRMLKRAGDILFSAIGIILLSPFFAITALAVKLYDGGPVFYKQTRLTRNAREFKIIKFRSMRVDAEKDGTARLSTGDKDDRITPVGRIIRKLRTDELPQLLNILKGDMSFVGPRPERPEIAEQYYKEMPDFKLRLQVKAGLTGYAQVYGKYNTDPYEKLEFDLLYINQMSFLTDLELLFATASILFLPESTEGVAAGQTTAMDYENETNRTEKWEKREEHWTD